MTRPTPPKPTTVAVVGAGLSALTAARTLAGRGLAVRLFEKARGPGGRMSTRRAEDHVFDHGAQYFTARDPAFRAAVREWEEAGVVRRWDGRIAVAEGGRVAPKGGETVRYVGTPRMSSVTRQLSRGLDVRCGVRVGAVERSGGRWRLTDDSGADLGLHDAVLLTTPPEQAVPLLADAPQVAARVAEVCMRPCLTVMAAFPERLPVDGDGLFVHGSPLSWVARNGSKPDRPPPETWVLHASPGWSDANLEREPDAVAEELLAAFFAAVGAAPVEPSFLRAHRWRYALADEPLDDGCLWDAERRIGAGGDWCRGSRVEGAFLSGAAAAERLLEGTAP